MKGQAFAPAATPTVITMPEPTSTFEPTLNDVYNQISQRAYDLFSQRGYQHGNHLDDWVRAEVYKAGRSRDAVTGSYRLRASSILLLRRPEEYG